jgi:hypothetical protein
MDEREEVEHVPWGDLLAEMEPEDRRRRTLYTAAGLIGAVVVGIMIARTWWGAPSFEPVAPGTTPAEVAATTTPAEIPEFPPLYSEADLMADPPDPSARAAVARAEWFVTDYFTADLEPSGSAAVRAALPDDVAADLPEGVGDAVSYVEWARAFRVAEAGDGSYLVSVMFRSLGAPVDRGFSRQPVKAVEVLVSVSDASGTAVLDLPAPIPLPVGPTPLAWEGVETEPPSKVVDLVTARSTLWGSEPRILSVRHLDGVWRVVVSVADDVGARWPLALRILDSEIL